MGNSSSRQVSALNEFVTNLTFDTIIKINNQCKVQANTTQTQDIFVGTSDELMAKCLDLTKDPKGCAELRTKGGKISNIDQLFEVDISSTCKFEQEDVNKLVTELQNQLNAKVEQMNDDIGSALKNITTMLGGNSEDKVSVKNTVNTQVKNTFTKDTVNEMITSYTGSQGQQIRLQNALDSSITNVRQATKAKVMGEMVAKNKTLNEAVTKLENKGGAEGKQQNKGLSDIVNSIIGGIAGIVGSVTNAYIAIAVVCALVCCVCSIALPSIFMAAGESGVSRNLAGVATAAINKAKPI